MEVQEAPLVARIEHSTGINLEQLTGEIREAAITLGILRAKNDAAESMRTVIRSQAAERIRMEMTDAGEKVTESRLGDLAQASDEYREHLAAQESLRSELVMAEADYYAVRNRRENAVEMLRFARTELYSG